MTRQPSTREPRTAAGRELLRWQSHGPGGYNPVNEEYWSKRIVAIEAEAAAPAGLDVDALAQAIHQNYSAVCPNHPMERCPYTRSTRSGAVDFMARAEKIAAEYARLSQGTSDE